MIDLAVHSEPTLDQRLRQIRKANAKTIEAELYNYRRMRQMLTEALRDLDLTADSTVMPAPPSVERVQTNRHDSDIVSERAEDLAKVRRYTVAVLQETARRLEAIEWMLRHVAPDVRRFVDMRWIGVIEIVNGPGGEKQERVRWYQDVEIEKVLEVSTNTLYRWRKEVVTMVAGRLGWIV